MTGHRAVVVGGSSGIGRELTLALMAADIPVVFTWFRNRKGANELMEEGDRKHKHIEGFRFSLTEHNATEKITRTVAERVGSPSHLAFVPAFGRLLPISSVTQPEWSKTLNANVFIFQELVVAWRESLESAVAVTSQGAHAPWPGYSTIGISKAALEASVAYLALELGPNTRVNLVCPGIVPSRSLHRLTKQFDLNSHLTTTPLAGRSLTAWDVAQAIMFVLVGPGSVITGTTLDVDSGARFQS